MKPYKQNHFSNVIIREFDLDISHKELVWHRDKRDRLVEVLEGEGWEFQYDNDLPFVLEKGDMIVIPKETYHRVKKGNSKLVIKIIE